MSKENIYEEALGILKNRVSKLYINHLIGNKDIAKLEILDIAKAIENHVMPIFEQALTKLEQAQKQDKLLELYKELQQMNEYLIIASRMPALSSAMDNFNEMGGGVRKQELLKQIKEMEIENE